MLDQYTRLLINKNTRAKQAVVAAPGGVPAPPPAPPQGAMPPMDPAMMGGMPPMDPAMMGGMPPMDPAMMGGMPPEAAPQPTPADLYAEVQSLKEMLQQLMDAQMAMMQIMMPPGAGMPPMAPAAPGPEGLPMDMGAMDPAMMGLPPAPPPGMIAQASFEGDDDARNLVRAAMEFLR